MGVDKRLDDLEKLVIQQQKSISSLIMSVSSLILEQKTLKNELQNLSIDLEADGNENMVAIRKLQNIIVKMSKSIYALDLKNTSLASVVCRSMNLDPNVMLAEYRRVMEDAGSVDNLIATTKEEPKED